MALALGCPPPRPAPRRTGMASPPRVPGHLLVGLRLQTASSRATTGQSELRSMLCTRGSVRWALSGVQGQGRGQEQGPAWAQAGTRREQAAGATASLLQPSKVAAKLVRRSGRRAQGRAGRRWPRGKWEGAAGLLWTAAVRAADGGWGLAGSGGELLAHPARPGRQEMRFLREGAGPGGLPGGRGSATELCRWVGGPGEGGGSGVGGPRLQACLPMHPTLPSHPVLGWRAAPGTDGNNHPNSPRREPLRSQALAQALQVELTGP